MVVLSRIRKGRSAAESEPQELETAPAESIQVDIAPNDPLLPYLQTAGAPVELERLSLDSPAVVELREAGVELVVPLISQGELIGMLNLGRRLSDQPYSSDDRKLLEGLASQVAPAIRVAQLVRRQQAEAKEGADRARAARRLTDPTDTAASPTPHAARLGDRGLLPPGP